MRYTIRDFQSLSLELARKSRNNNNDNNNEQKIASKSAFFPPILQLNGSNSNSECLV